MKIQAFSLREMTKHALASYCSEVERHIQGLLPYEDKALCDTFTARLNEYKAQLASTVETFGEEIMDADRRADQAWWAINAQLQINIIHYDDEIRLAARAVKDVFQTIDNPTALSYAEEYSKLEALLTKLSEIPAETLKLAMVDGWIEELRRRVDEFNDLRSAKTSKRAKSETGVSQKTRQALSEAYKTLIDKLNGKLCLSEHGAYQDIAQHINALIDSNRALRKAKKTAKTPND